MAEYDSLWDCTAALPGAPPLVLASSGSDSPSLDSRLQSSSALQLLQPYALAASSSTTLDATTLDAMTPSLHEDNAATFDVAYAALLAFVQANFTGPDLGFTAAEVLSTAATATVTTTTTAAGNNPVDGDHLQAVVTDALARGGEPAYHLAKDSFWLYLSIRSLDTLAASNPEEQLAHLVTWWRLRTANVLNRVLDSPVSLPEDVNRAVLATDKWLASRAQQDQRWSRIAARFVLEHSLLLQAVGQTHKAEDLLERAAKLDGFVYALTGALGKRTKWQREAKTQLVLLARSRDDALAAEQAEQSASEKDDNGTAAKVAKEVVPSKPEDSGWKAAPTEGHDPNMPSNYALNDDTLLEKTQFSSTIPQEDEESPLPEALRNLDPNHQAPLTPFDQSILLAFALNKQGNSADAMLTAEQMSAYVERVLSHPMNWSVYTMALLLRSRLEANRTRTVERSVLQLQALLDQMACADSSAAERLRCVWTLDLPPKWGMQAELARRYLSIGSVRSALETYTDLQLWEDAVRCLTLLGRTEEANDLVQDLLANHKIEADTVLGQRRVQASASADKKTTRATALGAARQAKLWCLLGDLQPEQCEQHYVRAWEVSASRSVRAARSLARVAFAKSEFNDAITWLTRALSLNPLAAQAWFVLGCAHMREEHWANAATAFRRSTALEEEDADAWNNLASCYLQLDQIAAPSVLVPSSSLPEINEGEDRPDYDSDEEDDGPRTEKERLGSRKKLAHKALSHALTHKKDSWRIWSNYLVVSIDVGDFLEAAHALGKVVEIRANGGGSDGPGPGDASLSSEEKAENAVELASLQRLVGAAVRAGQDAVSLAGEARETGDSGQRMEAQASAAHARTLLRAVLLLFDSTLLPRISSSSEVWQLYARLLMFQGEHRACLESHMRAWLCSKPCLAAQDGALNPDLIQKGYDLLTETVEVMENLHDRPAQAAPTIVLDAPEIPGPREPLDFTPALGNWKFKARSLVRTFAARAVQDWQGTPEVEALLELRDSLK